jgi:hypothetical protein
MENYYVPNSIIDYYIYDIFYNDNNKLCIIAASELEKLYIQYYDNCNILNFESYICPHDHTYVYTLNIEYVKNIELIINGNHIKTYVNQYPSFKNEIIFSTIVSNEDDYIKQWIDFHFKLGITRFIIYDNSGYTTLGNLLKNYIDNKIVMLFRWIYCYRLPKSGISGQTTQQNHSIYAFQNSLYIGLFDVDEYINIQTPIKIDTFFDNLIRDKNINILDISSFRLLHKFFYNPNNLPTDNNNFLKIFNCDEILKEGREKNFVIPKNVKTFSVHMVTDGLPMYTLDEKDIYFNHYYFLNKSNRGTDKTDFIDDSIMMDL